MSLQVEQFKNVTALLKTKLGDDRANRRISKGVYLISSGANDLIELFLQDEYNTTEYIDSMIQAYKDTLMVRTDPLLQI